MESFDPALWVQAASRWHSFLLSFTVVTWGLAGPLYSLLNSNRWYGNGVGPGLVLIILVFQVVPTVVLFLLDRGIVRRWGTGKALRAYRTALFTGAFLAFLRTLQIEYWPVVNGFTLIVVVGLLVVGGSVVLFR